MYIKNSWFSWMDECLEECPRISKKLNHFLLSNCNRDYGKEIIVAWVYASLI